MRVLGIDPGTASTGFGVVEHCGSKVVALDGGVISTEAADPLEQRLAQIYQGVSRLIVSHRPDALAIEEIFFGINVQTAFAVGQARGVVMLAAGRAGTACFTYTPQAVKKGVCGTGKANKDQVQRMVQMLLSLPKLPEPDHAADALAVAICHSNLSQLLSTNGKHDSRTAGVR